MKPFLTAVGLLAFISGCQFVSDSGELQDSSNVSSRSKTKTTSATNRSTGGGVRGACREEIPRLCGDATEAELRDCVESVFDELSTDCQADVTRRKTAEEAIRTACADDLAEYCGEVEDRSVPQCMEYYHFQGVLSDGCEQALRANRPQ